MCSLDGYSGPYNGPMRRIAVSSSALPIFCHVSVSSGNTRVTSTALVIIIILFMVLVTLRHASPSKDCKLVNWSSRHEARVQTRPRSDFDALIERCKSSRARMKTR
jgi:hypothetical protein